MGKLFLYLRRPAVLVCMTSLCFFPVFQVAAASAGGFSDLKTAISQVVRANTPAVVHIKAAREEEVFLHRGPFEHEPFLRYAYPLAKRSSREMNPKGTGIIIDAEGNILTTYHVVGGAKEILVFLDSGKQYSASLVGADPITDLAVIRISSSDPLPQVCFGDSDTLELGDWVIAMGHPRSHDPIVTRGIIRARHRKGVSDPGTFRELLQMDVSILNGYSGGPLLNLQGEVIGINTALMSDVPDFNGIGFAIPANAALHVARKLITDGKMKRGWLGLRIQEAVPAQAHSQAAKKGALVSDVIQGGPGDRAGLKTGDLVIAYQDRRVEDVASLRNAVAGAPVGEEVQLTVLRQETEQSVKVQIGSAEELASILAIPAKDQIGAEVRTVTVDEARKFNLQPHQGVMVTWVDPQGPLGQVGFEPGDIILEGNGHPFKSPESFLLFLRSLDPVQRITIFAIDHKSGQRGYVQLKVR